MGLSSRAIEISHARHTDQSCGRSSAGPQPHGGETDAEVFLQQVDQRLAGCLRIGCRHNLSAEFQQNTGEFQTTGGRFDH